MVIRHCPRCQGDLFVERLSGASDLVCLQCGFRREIKRAVLSGPAPRAA
jgi:hypothetical protein